MTGSRNTADTSWSRVPFSGVAFGNRSTVPPMKLQPASTVGVAGANQPARSCETIGARLGGQAPTMVRPGNVADSCGSNPGFDARRGLVAVLLLAALAPAMAVGQWAPQQSSPSSSPTIEPKRAIAPFRGGHFCAAEASLSFQGPKGGTAVQS